MTVTLSTACLTAACLAGAGLSPAKADTGALQLTSYVQTRLTLPAGADAYISVRRLKLSLEERWDAQGGYYVQGLYKDGNRSATDGRAYLQELRLWQDLGDVRLTAGMFKPPFGWERFTPDSELATADRSPATDHLIPCGSLGESFARDYGLQAQWGRHGRAYTIGLFGGAGANNEMHGFAPLATARMTWDSAATSTRRHGELAFAWRPARNLDLGAQLPGTASVGYADFTGTDVRLDAALGFSGQRWGVRGEYLYAFLDPADPNQARVAAAGFYVQGTYQLTPRIELALKYDGLDPYLSADTGQDLWQTALGANYYIHDHREQVQVSYALRSGRAAEPLGDLWSCQYQRFF